MTGHRERAVRRLRGIGEHYRARVSPNSQSGAIGVNDDVRTGDFRFAARW